MRATAKASVSREAQRFAAAILEVLAGVRTPTEAAAAMSVSVPRYYLWEQRALEGLVRACEPRPQGKGGSERHQIARLEKELGRLRQDCARQQALVRASQRTIGLAAPPGRAPSRSDGRLAGAAGKPVAKSGSKPPAKSGTAAAGKAKRKRRPVARALVAAAALQASSPESEIPADSSLANAAGAVQRSVPSSPAAAAPSSSGEPAAAVGAMPKA
jgi:hypothetical protein